MIIVGINKSDNHIFVLNGTPLSKRLLGAVKNG